MAIATSLSRFWPFVARIARFYLIALYICMRMLRPASLLAKPAVLLQIEEREESIRLKVTRTKLPQLTYLKGHKCSPGSGRPTRGSGAG